MIKKLKNKKGFAMAELLAVSMVVLILFSILFSNYLPLVAEYENRLSYNDVTAQYAAHYISKIYDEAMYSSDNKPNDNEKLIINALLTKGYYEVYKENENDSSILSESYLQEKNNYINKILKEYKVKEIIITTYNTTNAKKNYDQNSGILYNYIKYLPKYENAVYGKDSDHPEIYRVILKTDYGYATTSIKTSSCKVDVIGNDTSGANAPVLDDNMIPVYYDNCDGEWKVADTENGNWYNYSQKIWANSVTVSNLNKYKIDGEYKVGSPVEMNDILTMQVWIPRYKYKVWNYNIDGKTSSDPQQIEIMWDDGTNEFGEIKCDEQISGTSGDLSEICSLVSNNRKCEAIDSSGSVCNGRTYMHPAFTFDAQQLKGFWIGKFELTGEIDSITTKPNLRSLRNQNVSSFATNIAKMKGFSLDTDTHMIKNMEWGAVAYLSHSKYGTCTDGTCGEVYINNSSSHYTGRSGGNVGGSTSINETYTDQTITTQYNTHGFYTYDGYLLNYNTNTKSTTKDISKVASTTGNIYGVYDMSGGSREYTMANIVSSDGSTMMSGLSLAKNSGYMGKISGQGMYNEGENYPYDYYYDKYSYRIRGEEIKTGKLGDATKEMYNYAKKYKYGWNDDLVELADDESPWFFRGGNSNVDEESSNSVSPKTIGIFASGYFTGEANDTYSTRAIIVPNKAMVTQEN